MSALAKAGDLLHYCPSFSAHTPESMSHALFFFYFSFSHSSPRAVE
jgi:hypothetical protein